MYFKDFDFEKLMTANQISFVEALSRKLEFMDPPLIAYEEIKLAIQKDKHGEYLKIFIPHKKEKKYDLIVKIYDKMIIVYFLNTNKEFKYDRENDNINNEWIIEAVYFISEIIKGKYEIHIFYKGNKVTKVKMYTANNIGEKEFVFCSIYVNKSFLNPFAKVREISERISFFPD